LLKTCLLGLLFLSAPLVAQAQSYDWELYGGYRATRGGIRKLQAEADQLSGLHVPVGNEIWMNGGSLSIAEYKTTWFAGIIDLTGGKGAKTLRAYSPPGNSSFQLSLGSANPTLYTSPPVGSSESRVVVTCSRSGACSSARGASICRLILSSRLRSRG
jgi:hypothetical protein